MAPKAKAAATAPKAAPKGEGKKKKEKEEEKTRVEQPSREEHDAAVQVITNEIEALQKELKGISAQISEQSTGKDEFNSKKALLRTEIEKASAEINALQAEKKHILGLVTDKVQEGKDMRSELNKMKKNIGYTNESEIDDEIRKLEYKMLTESMPLKEEKKMLAAISDLKRSKPKVEAYQRKEVEVSQFDSGLPLKNQLSAVNDKMRHWYDVKNAFQDKFTALREERDSQMGGMSHLFDSRDELNKQVAEKITARNELCDEFRKKLNDFNATMSEMRQARADKAREERALRDQEYEQDRRRKRAEKLDDPPFDRETTALDQCLTLCRSLLPKEGSKKEEEKKEVIDAPDQGHTVLLKKTDREQEFFSAPAKKGKGGAKKATKAPSKAIKHNVETFALFDRVHINAPLTTDDLPETITKLEAAVEEYKLKIQGWEKTRDERKRLIMEGLDGDEAAATAAAADEPTA